jgi:hypothetical protein
MTDPTIAYLLGGLTYFFLTHPLMAIRNVSAPHGDHRCFDVELASGKLLRIKVLEVEERIPGVPWLK